MVTGTTPMVYETKVTPRGSINEEKRSPVQLIGTVGMWTLKRNEGISEHYILQTDLTAGDAIWLPYGVPHRLENDGDNDCIIVVAAAMPKSD